MSDNPGLLEALEPVAKVLQSLEIRFYIGGSVASSYHGASRSTLDVDVVADLTEDDVDAFVRQLKDEYYLSKTAIKEAIKRKSCFNLVHLDSSFKVDIFILKNRNFDKASIQRAKIGLVSEESDLSVPIASPEDTILSKLEWYRLGNEVSERQWDDVSRMLKVLGDKADLDYLNQNADELKVADLLQKLLDVPS